MLSVGGHAYTADVFAETVRAELGQLEIPNAMSEVLPPLAEW